MRIRAAIAAVLSFTLVSPALADPFSDLTKTPGGTCFHRDYDAAHLKKNPRQQTTSIAVWIKAEAEEGRSGSGNIGLAVTRRGDPQQLFLSGGCDWSEAGHGWMESYKKKGGAGCITSAVPDVFRDVSSAEEGGGLVLDPASGGQTMMVHLDDIQSMVKRANRGRKIMVKFGADDRVFLLRRTGVKVCDSVKDAVMTLEPGKPAR